MMGVITGFFGHLIWIKGVSGRRLIKEDEVIKYELPRMGWFVPFGVYRFIEN